MKQAELNVIFQHAAVLIMALPPAFDEPWWGSANITTREYLLIEQVASFKELADRCKLKFSATRFAGDALPGTPVSRRKLLLSEEHEFVNGIWARVGSDPYAEGKVAAPVGSKAFDIGEGCRLAAGIVNQGEA